MFFMDENIKQIFHVSEGGDEKIKKVSTNKVSVGYAKKSWKMSWEMARDYKIIYRRDMRWCSTKLCARPMHVPKF